MKITREIRSIVKNRFAKQFSLLIVANAAVAVLSFVSNVLINNHLSEEDFAQYRYVINFLQLGVNLISFGIPYSVSRLLAKETDRDRQRGLVGAAYALMAACCLIGLLLTYGAYYGAKAVGYGGIPAIILLAPWFLYITVLEYAINSFCTGMNRIKLLSSQLALPISLLVVATAVQVYVFKRYGFAEALVAFILSHTVIIALGIFRIKPSFHSLRDNIVSIWTENRRTGLPIYFGGLVGVASVQVIGLLIPSLLSMADYAQYALAYSISAPLSMVASTLGTVIFRDSASRDRLPRKVLLYSFAGCAFLAIAYVLSIRFFILLLFGQRYLAAAPMAQVMGVGALMVGLGDMINRFLGANGKGRLLMIGAIVTGVTSVVSAYLLLPPFGAMGAAASRGASNLAYLAIMIVLYVARGAKVFSKPGGTR